MIELTFFEAAKCCGGELIGAAQIENEKISGIFIDSRQVTKGSLFVALKGEHVDGHDYIADALLSGASCVISEKPCTGCHILVDSCFDAMKRIAAYIREKSGIKVIAIVGSVGKTSTRQMVSCVLSQKFDLLSTEGNFNNEYGLPQTLFRLEKHHEIAVLELGISYFGEMDRLGMIAKPDYSIYTNIGNMHLENLMDRDGVLRAKTELVAHMPKSGRLFFYGEDDKLRGYSSPIPVTYFGMDDSYDIYPTDIEQIGVERTDFTLNINGQTSASIKVSLSAIGIHMVKNAVAAANIAIELGLTPEEIKAGIESYSPVGHRGRILKLGEYTIVDDCYNAGPDSMRAAIIALKSKGRRIALLGDMLELGERSDELHYELGAFCADAGLDMLFTIGDKAEKIHKGAIENGLSSVIRTTYEEVVKVVSEKLKKDDVLLVKASRGMHFEKIIDGLLDTNNGNTNDY